jgi:hypothetical protein
LNTFSYLDTELLPSTPLSIHYSLITTLFNSVQSELLKPTLTMKSYYAIISHILVGQYSETNVMQVLLGIKGLCMFRALLAYPQEVVHKWYLVYCVRVMSVGCTRIRVNKLNKKCITVVSLY